MFLGEPRRLRLPPYGWFACVELHDMFSPKHESSTHGTVRENVMGRTESFGRGDHKLVTYGARLAAGAHQKGTVERVHDGQLYGRHHRLGFHKTRLGGNRVKGM